MSDGNPDSVKNVFFGESGYDIMAFYQLNRQKIEKESSVFVSLGGSFSNQQFSGIMRHYGQAKAVDCCDNDLNGRIYGIRMAGLLDGVHFNISKTNATASIHELTKFMEVNPRMAEWKPAKAFKDWNDQAMNKPMEPMALANKYQRNEKLAENRAKGVKL